MLWALAESGPRPDLRTEDVFPGTMLQQATRLLRKRSVHPDDGIRRLVRDSLTTEDFEGLSIPLAILATDALTAHPKVITSGPLEPALLASTAIPGVLPPVEAPMIADRVPVLYLPRPCVHDHDPLDFSRTEDFIDGAREEGHRFLAEAPVPRPGQMAGAPHAHEVSPLNKPLTAE